MVTSTAKEWSIDLREEDFVNLFRLLQDQNATQRVEIDVLKTELEMKENKIATLLGKVNTNHARPLRTRRTISVAGRRGFQFSGYMKNAPEDVKKKARDLRDSNGYEAAVRYLQAAWTRKNGIVHDRVGTT
jgi:hypothetical protein